MFCEFYNPPETMTAEQKRKPKNTQENRITLNAFHVSHFKSNNNNCFIAFYTVGQSRLVVTSTSTKVINLVNFGKENEHTHKVKMSRIL